MSIVDPRAATPGAKTLRVTNTGGTAMAGKTLLVDAASLGFDGNLLSKGDMRLVLNQDVVVAQASRTTADRDLSIVTSGNITNSGTLAAGHALTLSARNIDNTATGDIQGKANPRSRIRYRRGMGQPACGSWMGPPVRRRMS